MSVLRILMVTLSCSLRSITSFSYTLSVCDGARTQSLELPDAVSSTFALHFNRPFAFPNLPAFPSACLPRGQNLPSLKVLSKTLFQPLPASAFPQIPTPDDITDPKIMKGPACLETGHMPCIPCVPTFVAGHLLEFMFSLSDNKFNVAVSPLLVFFIL